MSALLKYSLFEQVLFPELFTKSNDDQAAPDLMLAKLIRARAPLDVDLRNLDLVMFDFETTGLDPRTDRIIEIGAIRLRQFEQQKTFSSLVSIDFPLPEIATSISGITEDMLQNKPNAAQVIPEFLEFIEGAVLVAHNAEFDWSFLRAEADRLGFDIEMPCFCTLKMARVFLNELESKNLDRIAAHYGLEFEARHRAMGDVKVTAEVLHRLLDGPAAMLKHWTDFQPYVVS